MSVIDDGNSDLYQIRRVPANKTKDKMVLFLNLDSSKPPPQDDSHDDYQSIQAPHRHAPRSRALPTTKSQSNPNAAHPFTTLLSSYPLLISLAKHLDLGDLATLSRTCHPFRSLLLLQRENLTSTSLVCKNSGKQFCRCVKDLVNECRGCMEPVCRVRSLSLSSLPYNDGNANGGWVELHTETKSMGTIFTATPLVPEP